MIRLVAFDADDTLWHNERLFIGVQERFHDLLARYTDPDVIEQRLYETEVANLRHYGYGVKSFTLSMIETAIDLTEGRIAAPDVEAILHMGREMLLAPVEVLDGVVDVVSELAARHELMVLTMGDLLDQESKVARSGLGDLFAHVEIVSRKDRAAYEALLDAHGLEPDEFAMIGNSLRSDIIPVAEMGGHAIHVPYESTWQHQAATDEDLEGLRFHRVETIRAVPEVLAALV